MSRILRFLLLIEMAALLAAGTAHGVMLSGIPGSDFSRPYFPSNKPTESPTGGKWQFHEVTSTRCGVVGTGNQRHAEIALDWGWRGAGLWYTDDGTTRADEPWRIRARIRADLVYFSDQSPERWVYLTSGDVNSTVILAMKFYPDKTIAWTTPTQSGTFTSATGIDGPLYRRVHFDYNPLTGRAIGGLNNEVVFDVITTPGLAVKTVAFLNNAPSQGVGTFFIDEVGSEAISIPGDVNGDGFVDSADHDIVIENLGLGPQTTWKKGDVSGNGWVDDADLAIVNANQWQPGAPTGQLTGILPEPQQVYDFNGQRQPFAVSPATVIVLDTAAGDLVRRGAALLQEDLHTLYGLTVPLVYKTLNWGTQGLVLCNDANQAGQIGAALRTTISGLPVRDDESYRLAGDSRGVVIDSPAPAGLFYGVQTLRQMLRSDRTIPALAIADWPDQAIRACYVGMPTDPEGVVRKLARMKVNMCVVESRWYAGGNWWYNPYGNNRTEALTFMSLCRQYNIEPVPLVQGFGWAYGVVDINPNCAEGIWVQDESHTLSGTTAVNFGNPNVLRTPSAPIVVTDTAKTKTYTENVDYRIIPGTTVRLFETTNAPWKIARLASGAIASGQTVLVSYNYMNYCPHQSPYCPAEPLTYQIVDSTLQNVINIYHPKYIHIGHDEVIYVRRCSRCQQSGKTAVQLIGDSISHWCTTIRNLDPTVKIMMWDDLARQNATNGSAIDAVPDDVILCPWAYYSTSGPEIESRMNWFVTTNQRPTLGCASGYFPENIWLWKDAVSRYSGQPGCLGFMFAYWADSVALWSASALGGEYMWSRGHPTKSVFDLYAHANETCRGKGLGLTLPLYDQRTTVANLVNQATAAGRDARTDANALAASIATDRNGILGAILPGLAATDVSAGTFPDRPLTQIDALPAYYWAMGAYVQARKLHDAGQKAAALDLLIQIAGRFTQWHFRGHENANLWVANYRDNNVFPTSQDMFGVTLN